MSKALSPKQRRQVARENRIRATVPLPGDVDLNFIDWTGPTAEELQAEKQRRERWRQNRLAWLKRKKAQWDAEEIAYYRRRCDQLAAIVAADKAWIERQNQIEAEEARVRNWYLAELEKEEKARDEQRRKKLRELTERINRDMVRTERQELIRRGAYRGRGGSTSRYYNLCFR